MQVQLGSRVYILNLNETEKYLTSLVEQLEAGLGAVIVDYTDDYRGYKTLPPDGAGRLVEAIRWELRRN